MKLSMKPETETFPLKSDPEGKATVTLRQMRTGDFLNRARLTERQSYSGADGLTIRFNGPEMRRYEAFLTLCGSTDITDEEGNDWFRFKDGKNGAELAMSQSEFNRAWDALPSAVSEEIHSFVIIVNPNLIDKGEDSGE